jgi:hypothetical protein
MHFALDVGPLVHLGMRMRREHQRAKKQKPSGAKPEGLIAIVGQLSHRP